MILWNNYIANFKYDIYKDWLLIWRSSCMSAACGLDHVSPGNPVNVNPLVAPPRKMGHLVHSCRHPTLDTIRLASLGRQLRTGNVTGRRCPIDTANDIQREEHRAAVDAIISVCANFTMLFAHVRKPTHAHRVLMRWASECIVNSGKAREIHFLYRSGWS